MTYLSLGSNLGNRHALLLRAIDLLARRVGRLVRASSFIETEPWGFQSQHPFLNAAVCLQTTLSPHQLLAETQTIERQLGKTLTHATERKQPSLIPLPSIPSSPSDRREDCSLPQQNAQPPIPSSFADRGENSSPPQAATVYHDRPIDIDILLYGHLHLTTPELTIPHPLMHLRDFVLRPLREIMPAEDFGDAISSITAAACR